QVDQLTPDVAGLRTGGGKCCQDTPESDVNAPRRFAGRSRRRRPWNVDGRGLWSATRGRGRVDHATRGKRSVHAGGDCVALRGRAPVNLLPPSRHGPKGPRGATHRVAPDEPRKRRANERHVVGCCEELARRLSSRVLQFATTRHVLVWQSSPQVRVCFSLKT